MEDESSNDLGDMFIAWTAQTELLVLFAIFGLGALGLTFSLMSFMNLYGAVKDSDGSGRGGQQSPVFHMLAIIVAGFVSVSGLVWGGASLVFAAYQAAAGGGGAP